MNFFILKNNYFSQKLLNIRYKYGKHHISHSWIATCLKTKPFFQIQSFECATRRDILMISTNLDFGVVHHNKNKVQNI
jgi:hypothetical protein